MHQILQWEKEHLAKAKLYIRGLTNVDLDRILSLNSSHIITSFNNNNVNKGQNDIYRKNNRAT
jgi:hypothetical protein